MIKILDRHIIFEDGSQITLREIVIDWLTDGSPFLFDKAYAEEIIKQLEG